MRARRRSIEAFCARCGRAIAEGEEYVRDSYREYLTPYGMQTWDVILCGSCRDDPLSWELARLRADLALRDALVGRPEPAAPEDPKRETG